MDPFCPLPWGFLSFLAVLLWLLLWLTARIERNRGRLDGLREADQRNRHQALYDYMRGRFDGVRSAAVWLREHGRADDAAALPAGLPEDPRSTSSQ